MRRADGEEFVRVNAHIAEQGLKIVKTAADVDRALAGEPHVVLSVEGVRQKLPTADPDRAVAEFWHGKGACVRLRRDKLNQRQSACISG